MSNDKTLKEEIAENRSKFKHLSLGGKIKFISDYYRLYIFAAVIIVLLIISIIKTVKDNDYETAINIIIANNTVVDWVEENDVLESYISDGFAPQIGADNVKKRVLVNDYFLVADKRDSELSAINSQTITAMFAAAQIDVFIGDRKAIDYFASDIDPFFTNLSEFLNEEDYKLSEDLMIYYTYKDKKTFPFAIDITGTPFAVNAGFVSDQVIIAIPDNTERPEAAIEFIRYVLSVS